MTYAGGARHRCAVCGRTELDDPNLEFRFCSKVQREITSTARITCLHMSM